MCVCVCVCVCVCERERERDRGMHSLDPLLYVSFLFLSFLCSSAKMDNAHKEFQKAMGAAICRYVPERGVLSVISRSEHSKKRSSMLQEMHFRNLSQKVLLLKRTEEAARQLESTKLQNVGG